VRTILEVFFSFRPALVPVAVLMLVGVLVLVLVLVPVLVLVLILFLIHVLLVEMPAIFQTGIPPQPGPTYWPSSASIASIITQTCSAPCIVASYNTSMEAQTASSSTANIAAIDFDVLHCSREDGFCCRVAHIDGNTGRNAEHFVQDGLRYTNSFSCSGDGRDASRGHSRVISTLRVLYIFRSVAKNTPRT